MPLPPGAFHTLSLKSSSLIRLYERSPPWLTKEIDYVLESEIPIKFPVPCDIVIQMNQNRCGHRLNLKPGNVKPSGSQQSTHTSANAPMIVPFDTV